MNGNEQLRSFRSPLAFNQSILAENFLSALLFWSPWIVVEWQREIQHVQLILHQIARHFPPSFVFFSTSLRFACHILVYFRHLRDSPRFFFFRQEKQTTTAPLTTLYKLLTLHPGNLPTRAASCWDAAQASSSIECCNSRHSAQLKETDRSGGREKG